MRALPETPHSWYNNDNVLLSPNKVSSRFLKFNFEKNGEKLFLQSVKGNFGLLRILKEGVALSYHLVLGNHREVAFAVCTIQEELI